MHETILYNPSLELAGILVLGLTAQWLAWRFHLPSILILLLFGLLAGEWGLIRPDFLLGDLLLPVVSFSVALILFEGSLGLRMEDLKDAGKVIRNIILLGIPITWLLCTLACLFILQLPLSLSLLVSAILTVTGPTVILPLLRYIRPTGQTARVLRWEGIINDPIGTLLAVIVYESILTSGIEATFMATAGSLVKTLLVGALIGYVSAWIFVFMLSRQWIPRYLQNPLALMLVLAVFVLSNQIQTDSGLFTVTLMGLILANQKLIPIHHIIEFKENLGLILLSTLFILLSARLRIDDFFTLGWPGLLFLAVLILLIRPATVFACTHNSTLSRSEKIFLSAMAPRGIVAAAISAVFALRLEESGYEQASAIVQVVFLVIIGTVTIYGLIAMPLARALKIAGRAQGVLILGAQRWVRDLAEALQKTELPVILVDSNPFNVSSARLQGLDSHYGNILSDETLESLDLTDIGHFLALTPNSEVNTLASIRFEDVFGPENVYQLAPDHKSGIETRQPISDHLKAHTLFDGELSHQTLQKRVEEGEMRFRATTLSRDFTFEKLQELYENRVIPLFLVSGDKLSVFTVQNKPTVRAGIDQKLVYLAPVETPSETEDRVLPA